MTIHYATAGAERVYGNTEISHGALVQRANREGIQKYQGATQIDVKTKELRKKQFISC